MNKSDSRIFLDILNNSKWTLTQKKKKISILFQKIVGEECPTEALLLIMGRDNQLCKDQLNLLLNIISALKMSSSKLDQLFHLKIEELIQLLMECKIIKITARLIEIQLSCWKQETKGFDFEEVCESFLLKLRFCSLIVIHHIIQSNLYFKRTLKDQVIQSNILSIIMNCIESDPSMIIVCISLTILETLLKNADLFFNHFINKENIFRLGPYMFKDMLSSRMIKWVNNGISGFEKNILISLPDGYLRDLPETNESEKNVTQKELKAIAIKWSLTAFINCAKIFRMGITVNHNKINFFENNSVSFKGVLMWVRCPPICAADLSRYSACLQIFANLCHDNKDTSQKLIDNYDFIDVLEIGVSYPCSEVNKMCLCCIENMAKSGKTLRHKLILSKIILNSVISRCFSPDKTLLGAAINCLNSLADNTNAIKILNAGFGLLELLKLKFFCDIDEVQDSLSNLQKVLEKGSGSVWKKQSKLVESFEAAKTEALTLLKELGNRCYQEGNYEKALQCYSTAISKCLPTSKSNGVSITKENSKITISIYEFQSCTNGHSSKCDSLPVILYSNRAQCYLQLKNFNDAIKDCDHAIALSSKDDLENRSIFLKSVFRRATAYMHLEAYHFMLADAAYCRILEPEKQVHRNMFDKAYKLYRQMNGNHSFIKRCINCLEGEGEKLKRCAQCDESYCSRACQIQAWESGHKDECQKKN